MPTSDDEYLSDAENINPELKSASIPVAYESAQNKLAMTDLGQLINDCLSGQLTTEKIQVAFEADPYIKDCIIESFYLQLVEDNIQNSMFNGQMKKISDLLSTHKAMFSLLVNQGATILDHFSSQKKDMFFDIVEHALNADALTLMLSQAAVTGDIADFPNIASCLLRLGANINGKLHNNPRNASILHYLLALETEYPEQLIQLIESLRNERLNTQFNYQSQDNFGNTPLLLAIMAEEEKAALLLLKLNSSNLKVGIDLKDMEGRSALLMASAMGMQSVVDELLRQGADALVKDNKGLGIYEYQGRESLIKELKQAIVKQYVQEISFSGPEVMVHLNAPLNIRTENYFGSNERKEEKTSDPYFDADLVDVVLNGERVKMPRELAISMQLLGNIGKKPLAETKDRESKELHAPAPSLLSNESTKMLLNLIQGMPKNTSLVDLSNLLLSRYSNQVLNMALKNIPRIQVRSVNLSFNNFHLDLMRLFDCITTINSILPQLSTLNLSHNNIGLQAVRDPYVLQELEVVFGSLGSLSQLSNLNLSSNVLHNCLEPLVEMLQTASPFLQILNLSDNALSLEDFVLILKALPEGLTTLDMSDNGLDHLPDEQIRDLLKNLKTAQLRFLYLSKDRCIDVAKMTRIDQEYKTESNALENPTARFFSTSPCVSSSSTDTVYSSSSFTTTQTTTSRSAPQESACLVFEPSLLDDPNSGPS